MNTINCIVLQLCQYFVAMVTIEWTKRRHADAWYNKASRIQFQDPQGGIRGKRKSLCFAGDLWPECSSEQVSRLSGKQLSAGWSQCQSLMPSLTHDYRNLLRPGSLWQKAILQIICLSSQRLEAHEAGLHMSPQPVQAGSSHRSEESADTWEQSPRRLSPLRASLTA